MRRKRKIHPIFVRGEIQIFREGFGFLLNPDGEDVFIPPRFTKYALNGDMVLVRIIKPGKNPVGRVVKILRRSRHTYIGSTRIFNRRLFVEPHDLTLPHRIPVIKGDARGGQIVVFQVSLVTRRDIGARIVEILGFEDDPEIDFKVVCRKYNLPQEYPESVINDFVIPSKKGRIDLKEENIYTIDPKTAQDYDDAISIRPLRNGYLIGIHIADVSSFVPYKSSLDKEALSRGTSIYLINKVVPMLPPILSKDLCSLQPGKERFAFSVFMELTKNGRIKGVEFKPSIIRTKARLTYEDAQRIIEGSTPQDSETVTLIDFETLRKDLLYFREVADILRNNRRKRGSLDFDLPEPIFEFDEEMKVISITPSIRLVSHRIIEELMILANRVVATFLKKNSFPCVYRVHEPPPCDKLERFIEIYSSITNDKVKIPKEVNSKFLMKLLEKEKDEEKRRILNYHLLRSMSKAYYSTKPIGHFGLALKNYTHFTSPIRRYPDLMVHRILYLVLQGKKFSREFYDELEEVSKISSQREVISQEAEFEIEDLKKLDFVRKNLNQVYEGYIVKITPHGMFVEIPKFLIEGFCEGTFDTKKFKIGQLVEVKPTKVDKYLKRLTLEVL